MFVVFGGSASCYWVPGFLGGHMTRRRPKEVYRMAWLVWGRCFEGVHVFVIVEFGGGAFLASGWGVTSGGLVWG